MVADNSRAPPVTAWKDWTPDELRELLGPPPLDLSTNGGAQTIESVMSENAPAHLRRFSVWLCWWERASEARVDAALEGEVEAEEVDP